MRKGRSENKSRLKQPILWVTDHRQGAILIAVAIGILLAAIFITSSCTAKADKRDADQATKRLNELIEQHEQDKIRWETEKEIEIELRMEQARMETQAEMSAQIAELNKRLEEENQAYEDLIKSFDDLKNTYQQLMDTVFGPASFLPGTDPLQFTQQFASAAIVDGKYCFLDTVEEYLSWKQVASEQSYQHLINSGRTLVQGGQLTGTATEAYKKAAIIAYCGYKWDKWLEHMGFTHCSFYGHGVEYVYHFYLRGIPWEYGLIVLEFESTFGLGAPGNPWGFIGGSSGLESFCNFASGHTGSVYEFVEWYHNPEDAGHELYRFNFNNRMIQIQSFCP
jgi:low affinity Fe/Cu permease